MKRMNIGLNMTKTFIKYSYVLLKSIFENNIDYNVHIYVFSGNIEKNDLSDIKDLATYYGGEVILLTVSPKLIGKIFRNELPEHPLYMHTFYFMFELLPNDVERILVMDSDMVVKKSLSELYETDFEDNYVVCLNGDCVSDTPKWQETFRKLGTDFFSAICALYNVKKILKDFTLDDIIAADARVNEVFGRSNEEWGFAVLFNGKIKYVSEKIYGFGMLPGNISKFSDMTFKEIKNFCDGVVALHYHRAHPWEKPMIPTQKYWWEYAKQTPYYDEFLE